MHYYQFNIGDYAKRTRHLSNIEDLAYRRLIDLYYITELPIPDDINKTARLITMRENAEEISNVLVDFFVLDNGFWHNKRADEEIINYHSKALVARANGKKGGRPPKPNHNPEITQRVNLANPEITGSKANQEPLTNNHKPVTSKQDKPKDLSPKGDDRVQQVFEHWCSVFNKTTSTKLTVKRKNNIFARIKDGYTLEEIKSAIDGCSRSSYHMGQNESATVYDDLELICRSGEKLEQFMTNYNNTPTPKQTKLEQNKKKLSEWVSNEQPRQERLCSDNDFSGRSIQQDIITGTVDDLL